MAIYFANSLPPSNQIIESFVIVFPQIANNIPLMAVEAGNPEVEQEDKDNTTASISAKPDKKETTYTPVSPTYSFEIVISATITPKRSPIKSASLSSKGFLKVISWSICSFLAVINR